MILRQTLTLAAALLALALTAAAQQQQRPFQELTPPQPTEPGKIEVVEFFWYGCPHCYSIEPLVEAWVKKLPDDVSFRRVPAVPNPSWAEAGLIYYTLEAMGLLEQYHSKVFDAWHKDRKNLSNRKLREEWLAANGIDVAKFNEVAKSFAVVTRMQRARQLTRDYKVDGVPRVFVDGKYYTAAEFAGGNDRIFPVVDRLIEMVRREKGTIATPGAPAAPKR